MHRAHDTIIEEESNWKKREFQDYSSGKGRKKIEALSPKDNKRRGMYGPHERDRSRQKKERAKPVHQKKEDAGQVKSEINGIAGEPTNGNTKSVRKGYQLVGPSWGTSTKCLKRSSDLELVCIPLVGFSGPSIVPEEQIKRRVTLEEQPDWAIETINFLLVKTTLSYNAIFGRIGLHSFRAIPSTHNLCEKFPTEHGVGTLKGNKTIA
ncbi:hypothetical protein ACH5RR_023346 [Cinchona calisaya]|uniref:Uncharacterized protein n=1 Tax=Cinchona calisaya TaxID=153742 RepID=A0ABD2ZBX5_9GENT